MIQIMTDGSNMTENMNHIYEKQLSDIDNLSRQIKHYESSKEDRIIKLQKSLQDADVHIEKLCEEKDLYLDQVNQLQQLYYELTEKYKNLNSDVNVLTKELDNVKKKKNETKLPETPSDKYISIEENYRKLLSRFDEKERQMKELMENLVVFQEEINFLSIKNKELETQNIILEKTLNNNGKLTSDSRDNNNLSLHDELCKVSQKDEIIMLRYENDTLRKELDKCQKNVEDAYI